MLLFEGEPALFFLFTTSVLSLLIGGCLWGSGEDEGNHNKMIGGIVLFSIGCATTVAFLSLYIYRRIRRRKKRRLEIERILQLQESTNTADKPSKRTSDLRRSAYDNRAAEVDENDRNR
ncbi:glutamate receptor NMDA [Clonorchis sinensis]|uniref:Glutamate receptor NMDA n=1 Tax=Clonorchis sinensis TaxID=79923 RepID=G7YBZ7_CLOSI|nr:glutamate receptor NMDA [Clonorchis sinensis]